MKILVLFFLGFAAGLSLAGCRRSGTPSPPPAASAETQDPREQVFKAMDSVASYRRSQVEENEGTRNEEPTKVETQVQVVCPGRSHFRITRNGRVRDDEYFIEGAQIYEVFGKWQVNRGNWRRAPGCPPESEFNGWVGMDNVLSARNYLSLYFLTVYNNRVKLTRGDIETVDDVPCQTWQTAFTGNFEVPYQVQFWIGVADNLPRRVLVTAPRRRVEIRYWDWNSPAIGVLDPIV